jgi:hypothetical protein
MIALKTEAACGACPLSMLCLTGKKLGEVLDNPRKMRFRYCKRCACVMFQHVDDEGKTETYLCGHMRHGLHWTCAVDIRPGFDMVWNAFGLKPTGTRGCGASLPRYHIMQRGYIFQGTHNQQGELLRDRRHRFDKKDCFYHYRASIHEVI